MPHLRAIIRKTQSRSDGKPSRAMASQLNERVTWNRMHYIHNTAASQPRETVPERWQGCCHHHRHPLRYKCHTFTHRLRHMCRGGGRLFSVVMLLRAMGCRLRTRPRGENQSYQTVTHFRFYYGKTVAFVWGGYRPIGARSRYVLHFLKVRASLATLLWCKCFTSPVF